MTVAVVRDRRPIFLQLSSDPEASMVQNLFAGSRPRSVAAAAVFTANNAPHFPPIVSASSALRGVDYRPATDSGKTMVCRTTLHMVQVPAHQVSFASSAMISAVWRLTPFEHSSNPHRNGQRLTRRQTVVLATRHALTSFAMMIECCLNCS
jgi:hypothetical protein